ncbi:MAG TPA: hypothetical protein VN494_10430 [Patescibacteria group bacterium]|nr:hypothetical protein [Patescibacteria group bacterium]
MEYVVVTYPTKRNIRIDGQIAGQCNDTLMVERGHHKFDLGDPQDYQPAIVEKKVQNTTGISPMIIDDFHPAGGVV